MLSLAETMPLHLLPKPARAAGRRARPWQSVLAVLVFWIMAWSGLAHAEDEFLPPEKAFAFSAVMAGPDAVQVTFRVAGGYYMYRERFSFSVAPDGAAHLGEPVFPAGEVKYDPTFEKNMEVYHQPLTIRVPLVPGGQAFTLTVTGQGCADKGICYPPMDNTVRLQPAAGGYAIAGAGKSGFSLFVPGSGGSASFSSAGSADSRAGLGDLAGADDVGLAGAIAGMGWLRTAGVFLLLGLLLSLTPCVLPMIPILASIVVGSGAASNRSRLGGLGVAAAYVLGMSLVYTALGVAAGLTGAGLAAWLQTPWVLLAFALVLALLALAMFDVFTLQVPASLQSGLATRVSRIPGGRATGAFVMGAVSALILGPCVAAPLAGALLYISQTGDVVLGGSALFAMAWGMGVPLLIVGASAGSLLPKAGAWMEGVKRLFGMLLLGTAWWMLTPVLPTWSQMLGWAFLGIVGAVMLRAFEALPVAGGSGRMFGKGLGLLLALVSVVLLVGAASGGRDMLQPLAQFAARPPVMGASSGSTASSTGTAGTTGTPAASGSVGALSFKPVRSVAELDALVAGAGRPVLLDFYADWCVSCREMEKFTFSDPEVAKRMSSMLLLRADVTANNADDRELLKRFRLFGPPGIMFYDADGRQLSDTRVIGFQDADRFGQSLDRVVAR
jgi:thiol:disulfide interchange protein DsbD